MKSFTRVATKTRKTAGEKSAASWNKQVAILQTEIKAAEYNIATENAVAYWEAAKANAEKKLEALMASSPY
jgi:hypothetical protein